MWDFAHKIYCEECRCRILSEVFRVQDLRYRFQGARFKVYDLGCTH